jgi:predicted amidophosphoribosyltransferase
MPLLQAFFNAIIDALFPVHPAEREILAMDAAAAFKCLPRADRAPMPEACSIFSYKDERVARLIWSVKYRRSHKGTAIAGYALYRALRSFEAAVPESMRIVVVPMPVTRARRRERGFNQCELLLDEIKKLCAENGSHLDFASDLLLRAHNTSRQTLKNRAERIESIKDMFALNEEASLLPELKRGPLNHFIVVIDDVITTGSTMRDAVNTLRHAGFERTFGLSIAH